MDYYKLFGVSQGASKKEINEVFRRLSKKYHPDHNSDPSAHFLYIEIQKAREYLINQAEKKHNSEENGNNGYNRYEDYNWNGKHSDDSNKDDARSSGESYSNEYGNNSFRSGVNSIAKYISSQYAVIGIISSFILVLAGFIIAVSISSPYDLVIMRKTTYILIPYLSAMFLVRYHKNYKRDFLIPIVISSFLFFIFDFVIERTFAPLITKIVNYSVYFILFYNPTPKKLFIRIVRVLYCAVSIYMVFYVYTSIN